MSAVSLGFVCMFFGYVWWFWEPLFDTIRLLDQILCIVFFRWFKTVLLWLTLSFVVFFSLFYWVYIFFACPSLHPLPYPIPDALTSPLTPQLTTPITHNTGEVEAPPSDLPGPPENLVARIVSTRFITLSWEMPVEIGTADILSYSVYWKEDGSNRWVAATPDEHFRTVECYTGKQKIVGITSS